MSVSFKAFFKQIVISEKPVLQLVLDPEDLSAIPKLSSMANTRVIVELLDEQLTMLDMETGEVVSR